MAVNTEVNRYKVRMVELSGESLGRGKHGNVQEAIIAGAKCAAKIIDEGVFPAADTTQMRLSLVTKGVERWSKLLHPNIVQFLGVHLESSSVPVLLMELFSTNLYQFLKSQQRSVPSSLKISILHDVACGLDYLHGQIPQITHGRLSAKKVFLDSGAVAKISVDVGITVLPQKLESSPYMPPEVTAETATGIVAVDIFSFGVLALFVLSEVPPDSILPPTYTDKAKGLLARNELERRVKSMEMINSQFSKGHPLDKLITKCLENSPELRPSTNEIQSLLWQAGVLTPSPYRKKTKLHLLQEMATMVTGHVHMKGEFEKHVHELQDQIRGLLQGMAKQRALLSRNKEYEEATELVREEEIAYIVNFLEGIQASKLGRELSVDEYKLKAIDFDYAKKCDESMKRVAVLTEWVRNCENATWSALVNALSCIGHKRMANVISHNKGIYVFIVLR